MIDHLLFSPFPAGYTVWLLHGEKDVGETSATRHESQHIEARDNPMQDMVNDVFNFCGQPVDQEHATSHGSETEGEDNMLPLPDGPNDKAKEFYELMRDGEQELYQGCVKYSKLSFLVRLYHIKCMCGMSDKAMTMIIELLHDAFENAKIPKSFYEAKKTIKKLGLSYNKIHACPNDCMLYRGADKERQECKRCSTSRWKVNSKKKKFSDLEANKKKTPQPAKVLRYFPLIPRLQRLFMSSKTSSDMRWHSVDCHKDGLLRHPRDAEAWKKFDFTFPEFSQDPHNVRLALASDGFNPFGHMSANHSIWPVVLIPYNTPPWVCMKQSNFILSMIIPGKRMPGNDIDVYLQPLIDELKELWDGVQTFDALSTETFKMRAALMWTISDFPGYGILSGWSTYDGYSSNISRCVDVNQRRLFGLKSHDCHILMQQLLPIALRLIQVQKMYKQNAENRRKQTYTHTNGSKSLPRRKAEEEHKRGRPMSRGELWPLTHKRKDSTYMNEAAKLIGEQTERIESQDGVSKKISEFDSLAQVLGKEHAGRVRGVGYGPTPTQVFGQTAYQFKGVSSTQANRDHEMEEMKLKMQELQSVVESERSRRRALENFLTRYIVQQGMELPAELADMDSAATASNRPRPSSSSKC
ncbi:uncharacterized protein LOC132616141 isoform X3 [Lycium barbarum]|uniref:uncharacterized protein LOC132616141 isoform X3 n=1 Tax=Lycium barbarum TaxID=112863 RepID=UPI00293F1033|nr:uncharacterized protein LOC132616141 isoform X3 [Lycium barbarum]